MTREQIENAIKCCNPYDENCGDCPFNDLPLGRCFEVLAKTAFNMLLEDREKLQKQVKEYQDKIEQGTLIELACKKGDKVYQADCVRVYELTVLGIRVFNNKFYYETQGVGFDNTAIGKSIFLTREEAEKRLKEIQNG